MHRAYSILEIKSVDDGARRIRGVATTPTPDRSGDVVEPLGASFLAELPLLLHHNKQAPVGVARFKKATAKGIEFEAEIASLDTPGAVKDRVDEAWDSVRAGLIRGVSIGFRVVDDAIENLKSGGLRFLKTEILELSLVVVPANAQATLAVIKSLDTAVSGQSLPAVVGLPVVRAHKDARPMTTAEQITQFETSRTAKQARLDEIMAKAATDNVTLDQAQSDEYDSLTDEVKSIDVHLGRLRKHEQVSVAAATPITDVKTQKVASELRQGNNPVVQVKSMLPKGTAFVRYAMAMAASKGDSYAALERAKQWTDTPEVEMLVKAAVNPGTIAEPAWAAPLAVQQPINDFLDLLRPATLIGKIPGLRRVPFNISMPVQTGGGTYGWVGEGAPKPVGNLQLASATLGIAKAAGIIVISYELAKLSSPSAEGVVRNDMVNGMASYLDTQFIDPTVAAVATVSPASITNASVSIGSAGTSADNARTDIKALIASFLAGNQGTASLANTVLIMSESNAFALSVALNPLGQPLYPGLTAKGGTILGIDVVTSQVAGTTVALVNPNEILYADDGGVTIDVSREASVEMNTTPTSPVAAATVLVSLWQQNLIGLRAERFINWKRARLAAVRYTTATYV